MPTKSAKKSYRSHASKSHCKKIKRSAVCKRTSGCKMTKKTAKKSGYCRKSKNTLRSILGNFNIMTMFGSKKKSKKSKKTRKSKK